MVTGNTRLVGVMGDPVGHSLSPAMHNAAFAHLHMDWVYLPLPVRRGDLPRAVAGLRSLQFSGANVTVPHKQDIVPLLDELTPPARLTGAVNTLYWADQRLVGHNTDGAGLVRSLREDAGFEPRGRTVALLGAGGSARAAALELAREGVRSLLILARRRDQGEELARLAREAASGVETEVQEMDGDLSPGDPGGADLLINTTPVGMAPETGVSPLSRVECLRPPLMVYDLVYNPRHTLLLRQARQAGCGVASGLGMLLYQGALAFQCWTGREAPVEIMRRALEEGLEGTE